MNNFIKERKIKSVKKENHVIILMDDFEYLLKCQKRTEQIRKNQRLWDSRNREFGLANKTRK